MYKIVICDTDLSYIHRVKEMLFKTELEQKNTNVIEYYSGRAFVNALENIDSIDLLFLNVQMNDIDSYNIASQFRNHFPESILILCSNSEQPTDKTFTVSPFRFMLKNYSDAHMFKTLNDIVAEVNKKKPARYILASWYNNSIKLHPSEIMYISKGRSCCQIFIVPNIKKYNFENKIIVKDKLSDLYNILKEYDFEYAHSSYIVNLQHVRLCAYGKLTLADDSELAISRSKFDNFIQAFRASVS